MGLFRKKIITQVPSGIPELIKTTAPNTDYVLMVDAQANPYKITKANLLAGLSSGGSDTGSSTSTGTGTGKALTYSNNGDTNGVFYYLVYGIFTP